MNVMDRCQLAPGDILESYTGAEFVVDAIEHLQGGEHEFILSSKLPVGGVHIVAIEHNQSILGYRQLTDKPFRPKGKSKVPPLTSLRL